jgi:hypothetical protein
MSVWGAILLSGVAAAALLAWGHWRYLAWLAVLLTSYVVSVVYWDLGWPYAEFVAGVTDLAIVTAVAWRARYLWELWFGALYLLSAGVNMVYLASNLTGAGTIDHVLYSSVLEVINLSAILLIGGVSSFDKAGMVNGLAFRPWLHIFGRVRPVYARRNSRP